MFIHTCPSPHVAKWMGGADPTTNSHYFLTYIYSSPPQLACRFAMGAAEAVATPTVQSLVGNWFPSSIRSRCAWLLVGRWAARRVCGIYVHNNTWFFPCLAPPAASAPSLPTPLLSFNHPQRRLPPRLGPQPRRAPGLLGLPRPDQSHLVGGYLPGLRYALPVLSFVAPGGRKRKYRRALLVLVLLRRGVRSGLDTRWVDANIHTCVWLCMYICIAAGGGG